MNWQPIETAPKDTEVFIGCWSEGEWKFGRSMLFYERGNEYEGEHYAGWFWSIDDCLESIAENPTHWMPLPDPPSQERT
jgi:hypothetical protein